MQNHNTGSNIQNVKVANIMGTSSTSKTIKCYYFTAEILIQNNHLMEILKFIYRYIIQNDILEDGERDWKVLRF